jgi:hypothetical protein
MLGLALASVRGIATQWEDTVNQIPSRRRGSGNVLTHALMAVLAAALAAGLLLVFYSPSSGSAGSLPGISAVPARPASAPPLAEGEKAIAAKVEPGLVIINTDLQYNGEAGLERQGLPGQGHRLRQNR